MKRVKISIEMIADVEMIKPYMDILSYVRTGLTQSFQQAGIIRDIPKIDLRKVAIEELPLGVNES